MSDILTKALPAAPGFDCLNDTEGWLHGALKLRQTLEISPLEYKVHFCMPSTGFDPTWMQAEDAEGFPVSDEAARNKKVVTCLFPALVEHEAKTFTANAKVVDLLVSNKRFLPTQKDKFALDTCKVVSKATVLVKVDPVGASR